MPTHVKSLWPLDPDLTFLNHGSFGACPNAVLQEQRAIQDELERDPFRFMLKTRPPRLNEARRCAAAFVGADPGDIVFVHNATAGVNAVLRSLSFQPGDELLTTNHAYPGCRHALNFVARRSGAKVTIANVPFPLEAEAQVSDALLAQVTPRTKLALVDHVTSATGLVFPIAEIAKRLKEREVPLLVDGAHAPGMVELDLQSLGASYYAANFHKWGCAPKGTGLLWVAPRLQSLIYPAVISQGIAEAPEQRFQAMFDWTGTEDPSAWLTLPFALQYLKEQVGGWGEIRRRNRELALEARRVLCERLQVPIPAPKSMIGALAALPLSPGQPHAERFDPLQADLLERHQLQVLVSPWQSSPARVLRVSAQLYNTLEDYQRLAEVLSTPS